MLTARYVLKNVILLFCDAHDDCGVADQTILPHNVSNICYKIIMYVQICVQRDDHGVHSHTTETPKTACLGRWSRQRGDMAANDHVCFCSQSFV
jgi:hypothetical protein